MEPGSRPGRLERRARLLLRAYPPAYRADRGEEMLGTLLESTAGSRDWPPARDAWSLLASGTRARRAGNQRQGPLPLTSAAVVASYLLAAIGVTALLWRDPTSRIVACNPWDPDQSAWWLRYAAEAIAHGRLPALITTGMNAPAGVSAMWNPSILAPGVALSPVTLAFGPQVSLNIMLTAGFAGSAASLWWVLRRWGIGSVAAAVGGLAYGFSPALTQSAVGHYDLQFAVFPPLIAHFTAQLVTGRAAAAPRGMVKAGAGLGVTAALQLLTAEELLFDAILAVGIALAVAVASRRHPAGHGEQAPAANTPVGKSRAAATARGLLVAAGVFALIAGYPLWTQFAGPLTQHGSPVMIDYYKNDLEGFVQPSGLQLIHSPGSAAFALRFQGGPPEYLGYLGWPMLLVLAWAAVVMRRVLAARLLAVTFVVLEVFSLGGTLLYGGQVHAGVKLPWHWLQGLPLASSAVVDRFSIVADGSAAALLAMTLDAALQASAGRRAAGQPARPGSARGVPARRRAAARVAIALATAVVLVPLLPAPLPTSAVPGVPRGWAQVTTALTRSEGASVLTVPAATSAFTVPLRWQADTGQPTSMVGGYFFGPLSNGAASVDGPGLAKVPQYLNFLWLRSGARPVSLQYVQYSIVPVSAKAAAAWITSSRVSAVVAVTTPGSRLASYLTAALGPPAAQSGDVTGWRVR
jgi:hypothetical protein